MNNDFHQDYIEEAKQVLKSLEQSLLNLEKKAGDQEEIDSVYRYLHTLKGGAGMFGFKDVEHLAHELEYLYSDIRDGIRQQDDFVLDLTLHAVDVFADLIDGKDASREKDKLIIDIGSLKDAGSHGVSGTSSDKNDSTLLAYAVILKPEIQIFKRGLNFQAILDELQELGPCEFIIHNESIPFEKQLADKEIISWFEIILSTKAGLEAVKDVFLFMKESEYSVFPITEAEFFSSDVYQQIIPLSDKDVEHRISTVIKFIPDLFALAVGEEEMESETEIVAGDTEEDQDPDGDNGKVIRKSKKDGHVSVSTNKLDQLINVVSELVIFRTEVQHLMAGFQNPEVAEAMEKLERLTLKLRDSAFNIRLVPLNILHVKLQRLIRSVSKELGKEIEFITEGLDTELDRSMINALEAPLMHMIRNAIDHGIEKPEERKKRNKPVKGLLKFYSYNSGDHVFIQLQDDGNGIDFDKIRAKGIEKGLLSKNQTYSEKDLINVLMSPGFSTADRVTTVSGRGVGMDVVKRDIAALRGDIEISTEKGLGSIFTMRLPLTLTILDTLIVNVSGGKYLIPINEVEYCYVEEHAKLFAKKSRQIQYDGQMMPFVSLREYFGDVQKFPEKETVIVINKNDTKIAVVVDAILGKLQTVYKPLNGLLHEADCFSGASILGDGSMALILNALRLKK
jgi:two-component system chemotaxis sensor kinase CheA